MQKLKLLDLFSGIGGFSLGLERSGAFETVAFCEIEPFPRRVLAKHWPGVPIYEDVRDLTADRLRADGIAVDAICGGFPCQDISVSGDRMGLAGERSGLWSEMARVIGDLRPRVVIVENAAGLLSLGMGRILADLAERGFDCWWESIPASALGAPHERQRVWLVAYPCEVGMGELARRTLERDLHGYASQIECGRFDLTPWAAATGEHGGVAALVRDAASRRVDDGLPAGLDRIAALGNAVVPQIPELIGRAIAAALDGGAATAGAPVHTGSLRATAMNQNQ